MIYKAGMYVKIVHVASKHDWYTSDTLKVLSVCDELNYIVVDKTLNRGVVEAGNHINVNWVYRDEECKRRQRVDERRSKLEVISESER